MPVQAALTLGYLISFIAAAYFTPMPWNVAAAVLLCFVYALLSGRRRLVLPVVALFGLILPFGLLVLVGWPARQSLLHSLMFVVDASLAHKPLHGAGWFLPIVAAMAGLHVRAKLTSGAQR